MKLEITITDSSKYRYLWMKTVTGFIKSAHCARCLRGEYENKFKPNMTADPITIERFGGDILYFCGVSSPYKWQNNLHLAGIVREGARSEIALHNGGVLMVKNLEQIEIDKDFAYRQFPDKSKAFLTCRNFQFGAQMFSPIE